MLQTPGQSLCSKLQSITLSSERWLLACSFGLVIAHVLQLQLPALDSLPTEYDLDLGSLFLTPQLVALPRVTAYIVAPTNLGLLTLVGTIVLLNLSGSHGL